MYIKSGRLTEASYVAHESELPINKKRGRC